jgi:AcrR family transcriptional regulator
LKQKKPSQRIRDAERTVGLLKKATMEQLISSGFSGLSVGPIVERAGVSRGALFHHFPSKDHLVAAAFEELLIDFAKQLHDIGRNLRCGTTSLEEFVVQVSDAMASDLFVGCMEISLGIRSEFGLSPLIEKSVADWRASLFDFWDKTFDLPGFDVEERTTHWAMASNLLRGHAFSSTFGAGPDAKERFYRGFPKLILECAVVRPEPQKIISINTD